MNKKRNWLEIVSNFVSGKGFYVVVLVCVAAIALSGYYLVQGVRNTFTDDPDNLPAGGPAVITESPTPTSKPSASPKPTKAPKPTPTPTPAPVETPKATAKPSPAPTPAATPKPTTPPATQPVQAPVSTPDPTPAPTATPANLVFTWPVRGSILSDFAVETLAYDQTMKDWRTHAGLDISSAVGSRVLAAASGTVSAYYSEDLMGNTLEIDHGNGLVSVYSNLSDAQALKVGDKVDTGTVIGAVGNSASGESGSAPHLHFAMYQDDTPVNPLDYLPAQ